MCLPSSRYQYLCPLPPLPLTIMQIHDSLFSVFHFTAIRGLRTTDVVEWGMADCRFLLFCPAVPPASSPPQQSLVHSHSPPVSENPPKSVLKSTVTCTKPLTQQRHIPHSSCSYILYSPFSFYPLIYLNLACQ